MLNKLAGTLLVSKNPTVFSSNNLLMIFRRLFLDYHGLKLLWGWMIDATSAGNSLESIQFKIDLLLTLSSLPVPNKTMLMDSKLLSIVEKWAIASESVSVKQEEGTSETTAEENLSEQNVQVKSKQIVCGKKLLA